MIGELITLHEGALIPNLTLTLTLTLILTLILTLTLTLTLIRTLTGRRCGSGDLSLANQMFFRTGHVT